MKLTFAVQQGGAVAEITISLSAGGCATPFDLADMSDEIKLAFAPQLVQLSERMGAAHIAALKEQALNEGMSFSARRRAQIRYQDLTGEELHLSGAPSFPGNARHQAQKEALMEGARIAAGFSSAISQGIGAGVAAGSSQACLERPSEVCSPVGGTAPAPQHELPEG